ncbi:MAG: MFS transporter [Gammaproteobacteria bacterium]
MSAEPRVVSEAPQGTPDSAEPLDTRSSFRQWYMVVVLALTYIVNYIDRGALNLMVEPIKHDLNLTDVQMSFLLGFAFVSLYSLGIVPAGYIADRVSRRLLLSGAVVFWSGASVLSGFAGNYWQLFVGRAGLGLGESALPPTAYSLLRDGIQEKNRGLAFSIYNSALMLGNGAGALFGGAVFTLATAGFFASLPFFGDLKPWQYVIIVPGLCATVIVFLLLSIREPPRAKVAATGEPVSFAEMLRYVRANARIYAVLFASAVTLSLGFAGWNAWIAAALGRRWGISPGTIGHTIGTFGLVLFPISVFLVGTLMDFIKRRWADPAGPFWVAAGGCALNLVPAMLVLHAPSVKSMWIFYGFYIFCTTAGVQIAGGYVLATVTPGRLMGKLTSFYYLVNNLLAGATAPTIMAMVAQYGFQGPRALLNSMSICYATFISITIVILLIGARESRRWHRGRRAEAAVSAQTVPVVSGSPVESARG